MKKESGQERKKVVWGKDRERGGQEGKKRKKSLRQT